MKMYTTIFLLLTLMFAVVSVCIWIVDADPQNYEGVSTSFSVDVIYFDGTYANYTTPALSLLPYSLSISDKEFEYLDIYLKAQLRTSGVIKSWSCTGTQQVEWYKLPATSETEPKESSTKTIRSAGSTWPDGTTKQLSWVRLHHTVIEDAIAKHGTGDWSFNVNAAVDVIVTFTSGASDIEEAVAPSISVPFTYEDDKITGFSLVVQNTMTPLSLGQEILASQNLPLWTLHALFPIITIICAVPAVYFYKTEE